jgi:hypothetical protein
MFMPRVSHPVGVSLILKHPVDVLFIETVFVRKRLTAWITNTEDKSTNQIGKTESEIVSAESVTKLGIESWVIRHGHKPTVAQEPTYWHFWRGRPHYGASGHPEVLGNGCHYQYVTIAVTLNVLT